MRTTRIAPEVLHRLPTSPCYLVCPEADKGLRWMASAKSEWRLPDGKPAIEAIAWDAGVNSANMFKLKKALTTPPANKTMARLVKIAASAHDVPRLDAQQLLFWFFDPDNPRDVERLIAYLENGAHEAATT